MDEARWEKFSLTCCNPPFTGRGLTLRAVAVPAAVVGDGGPLPAPGAPIEMSTECGGATRRDGQQHFGMLPADPLAVSFEEGSSRGADEMEVDGGLFRTCLEGRAGQLPALRANPSSFAGTPCASRPPSFRK